MTSQTEVFDAVVLGAGPGGYVAAIRLSQLGKRVAIIEKQYWGGVCLNVGCIPSKALLKHAELAQTLTHKKQEFGISGDFSISYQKAFDRSREVAAGRVKGIHYLMKKNNITEFQGVGNFQSPNSISVSLDSGAEVLLEFDHAILAPGAKVKSLPGVEFGNRIVTYEEQILESEAPKSIAIIGAGPIGVEFAYLLANFGAEVELIEFRNQILPLEDKEVAKEVNRSLTALGVKIHTSYRVTDVTESDSEVSLTAIDVESNELKLQVEKVMVSVGFEPNVEGYGVENLGIELNAENAVVVNQQLQSTVSNIYAIGDVTAKFPLAHVAEAQAIIAAENIAGQPNEGIADYRMMPRAVFCEPQVASFGLRDFEAIDDGIEIDVSKFPIMANGKANAIGKPQGFIKLIADKANRKLIGAHLVGADVSELLAELTLAHSAGLTVDQLAHNIHIHPTLSESLQEAVNGLVGEMINF